MSGMKEREGGCAQNERLLPFASCDYVAAGLVINRCTQQRNRESSVVTRALEKKRKAEDELICLRSVGPVGMIDELQLAR